MNALIKTKVVAGPLDRVTITISAADETLGSHLILRLDNDGRVWAWEPYTTDETFTLRLPVDVAYSLLSGLLAHFYAENQVYRIADEPEPDWRKMYEQERVRTNLLLDKLL